MADLDSNSAHWPHNKSVTNDIDRVCAEVAIKYPGCRIIYRDSSGDWDEAVHENGRFRAFKQARELALPREVA